jgi:hypothetical protein
VARLRLPGGVGEGVGFGVGVGVGFGVTGDVGGGVGEGVGEGAGVGAGDGFGVGFGVTGGVGEGVGFGVTEGVGEGVGEGVVVGSLDEIVDVDCGVACGVGSGVGEGVVAGLSLDNDVVDVVSMVAVVADVPVGEGFAVAGTVDRGINETTRVVVASLGSATAIQRQAQLSASLLLSVSHAVASARNIQSNAIVLAIKVPEVGDVRLALVTVAGCGSPVTAVVPLVLHALLQRFRRATQHLLTPLRAHRIIVRYTIFW